MSREVVGRVDQDTITLIEPRPDAPRAQVQVPASDVGDVVKVVTTATWRGGSVVVSHVAESGIGFVTTDRALAEREFLRGDQYGGWTGTAQPDELSDVQERVKILRKASAQ